MHIKEYLDNLSPEEFEKLCINYLKWRYKDKHVTIQGTRYSKDGGKDAEITANNVPYIIWAEVKKHQRAVGLEALSKNVVLVISKGINELIYFSTSNITPSAIKHISIVAAKHDFSVSFFYGESLYRTLSTFPQLAQILEEPVIPIQKGLEIKKYLSAFEEIDHYTDNEILVLQRDHYFYIDLCMTNHFKYPLSNIHVNLPYVEGMRFALSELDLDFSLLPNGCRVIQIRAEVLNCHAKQNIPAIIITYSIINKDNNIQETQSIRCGTVDPTKLIYYPLIGQEVNCFVQDFARRLETTCTSRELLLLDIRGNAGSGKSRLLKECLSCAQLHGYQTLLFNAKQQDSFAILREFLCTCIGIPFLRGEISCSLEDLRNVIRSQGASVELSDALYGFIFQNDLQENTLYYVQQALIQYAHSPVGSINILFAIDNLQCINEDVLHLLYNAVYKQEHTAARTIFVFCTNVEIIPAENARHVHKILNMLDEFNDAQRMYYFCNELMENDAKILYLHAFSDLQDHNKLLNRLISASGKRPFDIIMTVQLIHDRKAVRQINGRTWRIDKYDKLFELLREIPQKSKDLLKLRLLAQREGEFSFRTDKNYYEMFNLLLKSVLYFKGKVPCEFLKDIGIDGDMQFEIAQTLFVKFDERTPSVLFFHDNIQRFIEECPPYRGDRKLADKIVKWLFENEWYHNDKRSSIIFHCYLTMCDYLNALSFGLKAISEEVNNRNYVSVVDLGTLICNDDAFNLTPVQRFSVLYSIADAYRISVDLIKAQTYFEHAHAILIGKDSINISDEEKCLFYHRFTNAKLSVCNYEEMLSVLEQFDRNCKKNNYYSFILHNRYSVAYLALGEIDSAMKSINIALDIATQNNEKNWKSIAYSDKAYIYYRACENREKTVEYFQKAIDNYVASVSAISRKAEILAQEALVKLLSGENLKDACILAKDALRESKDIRSIAMEVKTRNLYAITKLYVGEELDSIRLWNDNILLCNQRNSTEGLVKTLTNLGVVYALRKDYSQALKYCEEAYEKYSKNHLSRMTHKPLIYLLMRLYSQNNRIFDMDELLRTEGYDHLIEYYNLLMSGMEDKIIASNSFWPLNKDGFFLNY